MAQTPPPEPVTVFDWWLYYSDAPNAFYKCFTDEAFARLAERKAAVNRLTTRADWENYQRQTRAKLAEIVGPFPAKTPLNPRVTGVLHKDGFRVEKIIYESQPNFFVTAALYVPEGLQGKAPAILYCSGHNDAGFRSGVYIAMAVNLVKKGFIVLAFDPVGQGERWSYFDPKTGRNDFGNGNATREHIRVGSQCFVTGDSLARYMIWDGIRSVDYLLTRPEVDPARIGITGRSGGGTQTAFIAACDDRIKAAAPDNYLTTYEQLLRTRGPQDPEQDFFGGLARGFDQADLLHVRAPKPELIVATTRDMFNIEGTETIFAEAKRHYAARGQADAIAMTVDDAEHESTRKNREAIYAFFERHLGRPENTTDEPNNSVRPDELRVTETGQVLTSLRGETVFTLNARRAAALEQGLDTRRRDLSRHLAQVRIDAARLAGYQPAANAKQSVVFSGRTQRAGYALEKYLLPVDERYAIPVLVLAPEGAPKHVVLYLNGAGKGAEAKPGGEMEALVRQGCVVVAPDVLGIGELGPGVFGVHGDNEPRIWYGFAMLGKSALGRQMNDVMRTVRFASARFHVEAAQLAGVARGTLGPLLLHTAAIENVFGRVAVLDALDSYRSLVSVPRYKPAFIDGAVPAALTAYDLPDLAACLAPKPLLLAGARDATGALADAKAVDGDFAVTRAAYAATSATPQISIAPEGERDALLAWLR